MKHLFSFPDYTFVAHHQLGPDEHAVLLGKNRRYSVCTVRPKRLIAMSPNYQADGYGLLASPLTCAGLDDLLQWTDHVTAEERYRAMANLPTEVVVLFPDHQVSG